MKSLIFTLIISLLTASAYADKKDCGINELNGSWTAYQGAVAVNPHTGICNFVVANGLAHGNCDFSTGFQGPFQGEAKVNKDCSATLTMDFAPVPVVSNFQVQLHKDKKSFVGRWSNNFGVIGVTNAVKR